MKFTRRLSHALLTLGAFFLLTATLPQSALADDFSQWHFYADAIVHPQADDSFTAVYADFSRLLARDLKAAGMTLDENSIRVAPLTDGKAGAAVPFRLVKDEGYDATEDASGTVVFLVAASEEPAEQVYRVFFDTKNNGAKAEWKNKIEVPTAANMIWNGSFEILSEGYTGPNRFFNPGTKMPRGWWGNFKRSIPDNAATSAHSGQHAVGFVVPEGQRNVAISSSPTPPGIRVIPAQTYQFSFWVKGEGLTSPHPVYSSIYWYGQDGKFLRRQAVPNLPANQGQFDWTQGEVSVAVPVDAHYSTITVGTYSTTGLLTVDDFAVRVLVPPSLANAKPNQP